MALQCGLETLEVKTCHSVWQDCLVGVNVIVGEQDNVMAVQSYVL